MTSKKVKNSQNNNKLFFNTLKQNQKKNLKKLSKTFGDLKKLPTFATS